MKVGLLSPEGLIILVGDTTPTVGKATDCFCHITWLFWSVLKGL